MAKKEVKEGTPRLPEEIMHYIISFLNIKQAAQTSVLSKAWLHAWMTCPNLRFNEIYFKNFVPNGKIDKINRQKFLKYVDTCLHRYRDQKIGIQELDLCLSSNAKDGEFAYHVNRWIEIAVQNGIRKIELRFDSSYTLPSIILEAKSLVYLSVHGRPLMTDSELVKLQVPENILCQRLQRLCLVQVRLDEFMFQRIISSCQFIQFLNIRQCKGLENFKVTNIPNLKQFSISLLGDQRVEVESPSLQRFSCQMYGWENDEYLAVPCRLTLCKFQNLKHLVLYRIDITDMFFFSFEEKFPNLQDLTISECPELKKIEVSSNSLKNINIGYSESHSYKKLNELQFDTPNIVSFRYEGNTFPQVSITSNSNHWVSEIHIIRWEHMDTSWFLKLKEFLTKFSHSKIFLNLDLNSSVAFNFEEIKEGLAFQDPFVQELSVLIGSWPRSSSFSTILDAIFWSCRPKTLRHMPLFNFEIEFTKFLYDKLMVKRNQHRSESREIMCWEQDLKEVKVKIFPRPEGVREPYTLDCETILNMLHPHKGRSSIVFVFKWRTS